MKRRFRGSPSGSEEKSVYSGALVIEPGVETATPPPMGRKSDATPASRPLPARKTLRFIPRELPRSSQWSSLATEATLVRGMFERFRRDLQRLFALDGPEGR